MKINTHFSRVNNAGFTLLELLIAMAIIGILYAVALPSYREYIAKSRRVDTQQIILQQVATLERRYTRLGGYPDSYPIAATESYSFSYSPSTAALATNDAPDDSATFLISAIPKGAQVIDECATLTINHQGAVTGSVEGCWR